MTAAPLRILLIATDHGRNAATMRDHVATIHRHSRFDVQLVNNYYPRVRSIYARARALPRGLDLDGFDAVVLHYTVDFRLPTSFDADSWRRLQRYDGLKVLFLQDEYQNVAHTMNRMDDAGIDLLFTCVPPAEWDKVYPPSRLPKLAKVQTLTGFVPDYLVRTASPALAERPIDVGYRARTLPFWYGELGAEKWQIAERFAAATRGTGLRIDVSAREEDRIYGANWIRFLQSCKATLGVESGASVFDHTGELERAVNDYVAAYPRASFEEVQARFLRQHEYRIRLNQISPRCFEAAALRTAMVLYEGEYSGILKPGRHYVPLRKDFSNLGEVLELLRAPRELQKIADAAYEEVARNPAYSFRAFARHFDDVIEAQVAARGGPRAARRRPRVRPSIARKEAWFDAARTAWLAAPGLHGMLKPLLRPLYRSFAGKGRRS